MELYSVDPRLGAKAFIGTGFNPDNAQHMIGSDAVRHAIWIQQKRDLGDYAAADAARATAERLGYRVMQERDGTRVKPLPAKWPKGLPLERFVNPVADGIIYDCEGF